MREIRLSGSEGGGAESNRLSLPLSGREVRVTNSWLPCIFSHILILMRLRTVKLCDDP